MTISISIPKIIATIRIIKSNKTTKQIINNNIELIFNNL